MQNRSKQGRVLCINCNICVNSVNTQRRFVALELDYRVISKLSEWLSPQMIMPEDVICEACWEIVMRAVNAELAYSDGNVQASSSNQGLNLDNSSQQPDPSHGHSRVCLLCGISILRRRSDLILRRNPSELDIATANIIQSQIAPRQISTDDHVCHPCWLRSKRSAQHTVTARSVEEELAQSDPEIDRARSRSPVGALQPEPEAERQSVSLPNYKRAAQTASHCMFSGCLNTNLKNISDKIRATVLAMHRFYIPVLSRVCVDHLHSNNWDVLYGSPNSLSSFTVEQLEHALSLINVFKSYLNFESLDEIRRIDDNLFFYWIGRKKEEFAAILNEVPRLKEMHRGVLGLASFLMKLRTGESDARIATLLEVPRRTLERLISSVRNILLQDFVSRNLGVNHLSRERLLEHNLLLPNALYDNNNNDKAIIICDGTYIFINKSSNYLFQKDTYSTHKYRNLLKPFLLVTCDGYILDCCGPYKATTSDAEIMKSLFENENAPLRLYFQENDVFILDRGFRDSINLLQGCGYSAFMPESKLPGEHQLTTEQANKSRCITICRWVVELVNGYFKRDFKLLRQDQFNKTVSHMMDNFKIAASLINRFGVRLKNRVDVSEMINIIRERRHLPNNLANVIESTNMNRRSSNFISITADENRFLLFPRMEENDLILFSIGTYQIRQARSYYGEHIRANGVYRIEVCRERINTFEYNLRGSFNNILIRGKIHSRHVRRKIYYVYILIERDVPGRQGIAEYYCNCLVGRRTTGCCAHIMTLVWYLGWARYQPNILPPAPFLDDVVIRDDIESE